MIILEHMKPSQRAIEAFAAEFDTPSLPSRYAQDQVGFFPIKGVDAAVILSVATAVDTGVKALWIEGIGGRATTNAKRNARITRDVLRDCEELALASGASEIRIEASTRTELKLSLFKAFGFTPLQVGQFMVMQKVLNHGS